MHAEFLAQESATLASVLSLVFCCITLGAYWLGFRSWCVAFGAAGLAGLCLYFGMLAVSAGPNPAVGRADIALWVRQVLIVTYGLLAVAFGLVARRLWRGVVWRK